MHYAFEDNQNLFLVIDLMSGGDLRFHIGKHRKFNEEQTSKTITPICRLKFAFSRVFRGVHVALP